MDQGFQQPALSADAREPAPRPADSDDEAAWTAPAWCVRLVTGAVLALERRAPGAPGAEAALAQARSGGTALVIDSRDVLRAASAFADRVVFVLPRDQGWDGIAGICARCGSPVVRWSAGESATAALDAAAGVPVLVATSGFSHVAGLVDLLAALARPAMLLAFSRPAAPMGWHLGLGAAVDFDPRRRDAHGRGVLAPPGDAVSRAHLIDCIERFADADAPAEGQPAAGRQPLGAMLRVYAALMSALSVIALPYLLARVRSGKEDLGRLGERRGRTRVPRPDGRLVWIHAASVGEALSVLPLIGEIRSRGHAETVLLTTGTTTSARLIARRAADGVIHQYFPLDVPRYARAFLDHWRPGAALFVESELWPNMMAAIARARVPFATVNARMSERALVRWRNWPDTARAMLGALDLVLAQSPEHARRFAVLGARDVRHVGNLKFDCPAPPFEPHDLETLRSKVAGRPVWLAASTHDGEEAIIAEAHFAIRDRYPDLLTILVPRHPERGGEIARMLEDRWLVPARRSLNEEIGAKTDVYLADTLGELGLFYRLSPVALVGGSLVAVGGHNPIEPAQLDCAVVHGVHVNNFADTYAALDAVGGAVRIADAGELASEVADLLTNDQRLQALIAASRAEIALNEGSLNRALEALAPHLAP